MNTAANLPAERTAQPPIVKLGAQLDQRADEFRKALPSHISPEKLQRTIITAAQSNPDLLSADRQSLIVSAMKAAQDGLLPDGREAALVIFSTSSKDAQGNWQRKQLVQYMPMVYGLRKKIVQSGEIISLQTGLVYRAEVEAGAFIYEIGIEPPIRHRPMLDLPEAELTDDCIVAAYSIARMKDGSVSVEVMRRGEINKVREASQTGATRDRKGQPRTPKGPWADWFGEMARKTVMRRHAKTLPMSGDVIVDVEGREFEAASSAARVLDAVEGAKPVSLPSPDELTDDPDQADQHDSATGEVLDQQPTTGMTEVGEEAARELDAGGSGDAAEGRADADMGEAHNGAEAEQGEPQPDDAIPEGAGEDPYRGQPWAEKRRELLDKFLIVEDSAALTTANKDFERHYATFPDTVQQELNDAFNAARRRVRGGGEGAA